MVQPWAQCNDWRKRTHRPRALAPAPERPNMGGEIKVTMWAETAVAQYKYEQSMIEPHLPQKGK